MRTILILLTIAAAATVAACGDDDDVAGTATPSAGATTSGGGTAVGIVLQEWSVIPDAESGPAGTFDFTLENVGPNDTHEFVIFKTDLAPDALPVADDGSVDEEGEGVELIDEVEDVAVNATETLTVDLAAGDYVFICNIFDETENEAHYQEGMRIGFTVE